MKITISYKHEGVNHLIQEVEHPNIKLAKYWVEHSPTFSLKIRKLLDIHWLKENVMYEYLELIEARNEALKVKPFLGMYRRMIVFLNHAPSFKVSKSTYEVECAFEQPFMFENDEDEVKINLKTIKKYGTSPIFHLKLNQSK